MIAWLCEAECPQRVDYRARCNSGGKSFGEGSFRSSFLQNIFFFLSILEQTIRMVNRDEGVMKLKSFRWVEFDMVEGRTEGSTAERCEHRP